MSEAVAIDIVSLTRFDSRKHQPPHCLTKRYQSPEHHSILRHPNQPFSSPSSVSSSSSSSLEEEEEEKSEEVEEGSFNESSISVDGEFDMRIDMILPSPEKEIKAPTPVSSNLIAAAIYASAPPLSDDECECKIQDQHEKTQNKEQQIQQEKKEEEEDVCIICYEEFEPDGAINGHGDGHDHHANYSPEELEEMEAKQKISNFCLTCKYHVHQMCLDEYRLCKVTDAMKNNPFLRHPNSMIPVGTFGIKCLICSRQVESIHISRSGDIDIVKTQVQGIFDLNSNREQQQMQVQIQEILHNRMQRRRRRRERIYCLKDKMCMICFCLLGVITILVLMFRMFL